MYERKFLVALTSRAKKTNSKALTQISEKIPNSPNMKKSTFYPPKKERQLSKNT